MRVNQAVLQQQGLTEPRACHRRKDCRGRPAVAEYQRVGDALQPSWKQSIERTTAILCHAQHSPELSEPHPKPIGTVRCAQSFQTLDTGYRALARWKIYIEAVSMTPRNAQHSWSDSALRPPTWLELSC